VKFEYDDSVDSDEEWELDEDDVDLTAKAINRNQPPKTMSVRAMGRKLGLRKTDSYWLAHKNAFKVITVSGRMRVDIDSFEEWYANQVKYQKIDGTPPGELLKARTYDIKDISEMLGICEEYSYEVLKANGIKPIIVDYWQRWPKDLIDKWYKSQSRYRNKEDREKDMPDIERTISMPEMGYLLGVYRNTVYSILDRPCNKEIFEIITVADKKRITKDSFEKWYAGQTRYKMLFDTIEEGLAEKRNKVQIIEVAEEKIDEAASSYKRLSYKSSNPDYYSIAEVADQLDIKGPAVRRLIRDEIIPYVKIAESYRIPKLEFDRWLIEQKEYLESEEQ